LGLATPEQISHFNGKPNVSLDIKKTKEGNAIELVKEIKEILKEFKSKYPDVNFETYTRYICLDKKIRLKLVSFQNPSFGPPFG